MKGILFLSLLIFSSCKPEQQAPEHGCTDPNSMSYDPQATVDDGTCKYGGRLSPYRTSIANPGDSIQFYLDTINGKGLHFKGSIQYNYLTNTRPLDCAHSKSVVFFIPLGNWTYQYKKKMASGQIIDLTAPKTVNVYNKYCGIDSVN